MLYALFYTFKQYVTGTKAKYFINIILVNPENYLYILEGETDI